ncbi:hypothetical protein RFI_21780 [Reticulomyxa filosa]|uniref:Glycoside hydrolase family 65 central catalytic domain-containing protein n=1 Tax=Reticulomyxa filosa TaxID=46433 RepID=X6MNZ6_RETFI|nr:hypothetical protein RFI_21780 [Reticulomyxa filosa]|eukprot:ETO15584.1 hypothetical protein RFI_21780 [Reticulomyxa filosa]
MIRILKLDGYFGQYWSADNVARINQTVLAHRQYRNLLLTIFEIDNSQNNDSIEVNIHNILGLNPNTADMNYGLTNCPSGISNYANNTYINCYSGLTLECEDTMSLESVYVITASPKFDDQVSIVLSPYQPKFISYFVSVLTTSLESSNPAKLATVLWNNYTRSLGSLLDSHIQQWELIWQNGRIDMDYLNDDTKIAQVAKNTYSSLYYIYSSIRSDWTFGLSPGGLASDAYNGHMFWDQGFHICTYIYIYIYFVVVYTYMYTYLMINMDVTLNKKKKKETWMYPSLLILQPDLAASALDYRYKRLDGALKNAQLTNYEGARFPWESAASGIEVCPITAPTGEYEVHISADIALAIRQYYQMSKDDAWISNYAPVIYDICDFWISRSIYNATCNCYEILDVIGPDEYNTNVNNSVYTNVAAMMTINFGIQLLTYFGQNASIPAEWSQFVQTIKIDFDDQLMYHPEFDGYNPSIEVKQADVAMFSVGWVELGNYTKADELFTLDYANIQPPFNIWTETASGGGAVNFITGAGGYLQTLLFGYPQLRIFDDYLSLNCSYLPYNMPFLHIHGIHYLGNSLAVNISLADGNIWFYIFAQIQNNSRSLQAVTYDNHVSPLQFNTPLKLLVQDQPIKIEQVSSSRTSNLYY